MLIARLLLLYKGPKNRLLGNKCWYKGSIRSAADKFQNTKNDRDLIYIRHIYDWVCLWIFAKLITVKIILNVKLIMFRCLLLKSKFEDKVKLPCEMFNLKQKPFFTTLNQTKIWRQNLFYLTKNKQTTWIKSHLTQYKTNPDKPW